jgi:RNA polymerase-binding protein DksA
MNIDEIRAGLIERRKTLLGRVQKVEQDFRHASEPLSKDSEEQVAELENDDVLEALDDAQRRELESIRGALARIDAGEYGVCPRCEEPIAPARLRALPTAEYCIRCAEALSG